MCHSIYLTNALAKNARLAVIEKLCSKINSFCLDFDTIAFTGMSGALIAPAVADRLKKNLLMIRKESDVSCAAKRWRTFQEGNLETKKYIIIDDLIASGRTVRKIRAEIPDGECVGVFLYGYELERRSFEYYNAWREELNCVVSSIYFE